MAEYRLTRRARADYLAIGRYTQERWGRRQRIAYLADLVAAFERLAANEALGRARPELRAGLFSYRCAQHVVFFRRIEGRAEVLRILHGRQSPERGLLEG